MSDAKPPLEKVYWSDELDIISVHIDIASRVMAHLSHHIANKLELATYARKALDCADALLAAYGFEVEIPYENEKT